MRRRAGQGLGNDRELLHMLTMDTGKSQKGHGGHQENIQLPETEGKLRLGFPPKHPNTPEISGGAEPRPPQLAVKTRGERSLGWENSLGEGARISPQSYRDGLCSQKSKLLASTQALVTYVGPREQCLDVFKANQFHDETQVGNKIT